MSILNILFQLFKYVSVIKPCLSFSFLLFTVLQTTGNFDGNLSINRTVNYGQDGSNIVTNKTWQLQGTRRLKDEILGILPYPNNDVSIHSYTSPNVSRNYQSPMQGLSY